MEMSKFGRTIGWLGCIILSVSLIPNAWKAWGSHDVSSLGWLFLITLLTGFLFLFIYIVESNFRNRIFQLPLWLASFINLILALYLCYVKIMY